MSDLAPSKPQLFKAVTGNRLQDGEVVFWSNGRWAEQFSDIELFADPAEAEAALAKAQAQPTVIVDPYTIEVKVEDGLPVPAAFRERVRALAPTIHEEWGKHTAGAPVNDAIPHAAGAARSAGRARLIRR
jgi:sulfite reductase (NADPH) hemoprotein beta-component